jgi:peptidoglycan/LPS O-acetylase OafA/YrhL/lysophospholipase L1-like esterase
LPAARFGIGIFLAVWVGACSHAPAQAVAPEPPLAAPPIVTCPSDLSVAAPTSQGATVSFDIPSAEHGEGAVNVTCAPEPGATFPIGTTDVECDAVDSLQRKASCFFSVSVAAPPRLRLTRIMAFGDSITAGQVVVPNTDSVEVMTTPQVAYPTVLAQLLAARYSDQRIEIFNEGKPTERSELALTRFTGAFGIDHPQAVVLLEGYNDIIFASSASLGIAAAEQGVSALAADARNRGARVFICTLTPGKAGRRQIASSSIQAANDRLRVVARGEGAVLIDTYSALLPYIDESVGSDGLHLTPAGYRHVAEAVFAAIRADLEIHSVTTGARPPHRFIPALDGIRGIAILLVLFHHFTIYQPTRGVDKWIANVPAAGWTGVGLFFVLSGYLITGILIDARGRDHYFRNFYARRALRIFPLYYLVIVFGLNVLPLMPDWHRALVGPYPVPPHWPYWAYLTNFSIVDRGMTHGILDLTWSLSIEEQFYLVWAVLVWMVPIDFIGALCAAIIVIEPIARFQALANGADPTSVYVLTFFRLDGLAVGSLLGWLSRRDGLAALDRWAKWVLLGGVAGFLAITIDAGDPWWWNPRMQQIGFSLIALGSGALVVMAVARPEQSLVPRLLSAGWLRAFGKYSYCLYLTHLIVMRTMREYVFDPQDYEALALTPWIGQVLFYISVMVPSFALAWISWRVFEAPILSLKKRFAD